MFVSNITNAKNRKKKKKSNIFLAELIYFVSVCLHNGFLFFFLDFKQADLGFHSKTEVNLSINRK